MLSSSSRSTMIILPAAAAIIAITTAAAFYWLYKKFRQPFYNPGMVSKDANESSNFDNLELYSKSTETTWMMPNGIELYHFPPLNKSQQKDNNKETPPPPVLALHGGPAIAPTEPWNICNEIPNMHLYHSRGCGKSSRPFIKFPTPGRMWPGMKILEETLGIGAQISDIERIRRRLDVEKLDLVGHSFGGFVATMYAAEFPDRVRSLTLLVPAAVLVLPSTNDDDNNDGGANTTEDLFQIVQNKLEEIGNKKHIDDYKAFMKRYLNFGSLPNETEDTLALRQNEFAVHYFRAAKEEPSKLDPAFTGGMACYATFLSMGIEHNYIPACKERLADSTFPVSIVHGGKDMIPVSTTRKYIQLFPKDNVEFYVVEDGDHSIFDHPQSIMIVNETMERAKS